MGERGGLNINQFIRNNGTYSFDVLGLSEHIELETGAALGIGAWTKVEGDFQNTGRCSDGTTCWKGSISIEGHVGIGLGGKFKVNIPGSVIPNLRPIEAGLWFNGPNLEQSISINLSKKCDSPVYGEGVYNIFSLNTDFRFGGNLGFGLVSVSAEVEVTLKLYMRATVKFTGQAAYVSISWGHETKGKWEFDVGYTIPGTSINFSEHKEGPLETKPGRDHTLWEGSFHVGG